MMRDYGRGFQLRQWRVYPDRCLIEGPEGSHHVEPKVMGVLMYLVQHSGQVVRRDELFDHVWEGTVVGDEVLSRAISVLRQVLGDNPQAPTFIQTHPKIGYRLLIAASDIPEKTRHKPKGRLRAATVLIWPAVILLFALAWSLIDRKEPVIDPYSPAAFDELSDWFDFLLADKAGTRNALSIAVLPFLNRSADAGADYRSENLSDDLMVNLSKVKGLKVVSRRSALSIRQREGDLPTIGRLLNVDTVVEGSIVPAGDTIRITAHLSNVSDGYVIWSDTLSAPAQDLYDVSTHLAGEIVRGLNEQFGRSLVAPANPDAPKKAAYQIYLTRPNFLSKMRGTGPLQESISLYQQALEIDPEFTRAALGLAQALVLLPFYTFEDMEEHFRQAEQVLSGHNYTEDRDRGEAEAVRAFIAFHRWNWIEAEQRFQNSLRLAPDVANTYQWYSQHLAHVGRRVDSLKAALQANSLDEVAPAINDRLGVAYLWLGDNSRAAERFMISRYIGFAEAINPVHMILYLREGRIEEFKQTMRDYHFGWADQPSWLIQNAEQILQPGNRKSAIRMAQAAAESGQIIKPSLQFPLWVVLGANDAAYDTFAGFRDGNHQNLPLEIVWADEGESFRNDSRFDDLAESIGWAEYWKMYQGPDEN